MSTPEAKVKRKLDKMLKDEGVCYICPQAGPYGTSGIADRIACVNGRFFGIEVKAGKNEPTPLQLLWGRKVVDAKGIWLVVRDDESIEELRRLIRDCSTGEEGPTTKTNGHPKGDGRNTKRESVTRTGSSSRAPRSG